MLPLLLLIQHSGPKAPSQHKAGQNQVSHNKYPAGLLLFFADLVSVISCYGGGLEANKTIQVGPAQQVIGQHRAASNSG